RGEDPESHDRIRRVLKMAIQEIFKLTVFAPRSIDPTETTPLTPPPGSAHSDAFVVATAEGIAGAKPYLEAPTSRASTIDPLNKKVTVGSLTWRVLDARLTPGGSNALRWVSPFLNDGAGGNALLYRRFQFVRSINGGVTWTPNFTGRIGTPGTSGKLWYQFTGNDI